MPRPPKVIAPLLPPVLTGWTTPTIKPEERLAKYSTTGDILGFRRCRRQYGIFKARGFEASADTQLYFGTLIHDVLDQINREYRINSSIPDEAEVKELVEEAHERLSRSGIRPYNPTQQKERACKLIWRFIQLVGAKFFPHVQETEYRLERELVTNLNRPYILHGIVDILSGAIAHDLGLNYATFNDDIEIWDYKSGKMPPTNSPLKDDYIYQMWVYAELYRQQTGEYPARCVLVFIGELDNDAKWKIEPTVKGFANIFLSVDPNPGRIKRAIDSFHATVEDIEAERALLFENQWKAPTHDVDGQTCEACELRYDCDKFPQGAKALKKGL